MYSELCGGAARFTLHLNTMASVDTFACFANEERENSRIYNHINCVPCDYRLCVNFKSNQEEKE